MRLFHRGAVGFGLGLTGAGFRRGERPVVQGGSRDPMPKIRDPFDLNVSGPKGHTARCEER